MDFSKSAASSVVNVGITERTEEGLPHRRGSYLQEVLDHEQGEQRRVFMLRLADQFQSGMSDEGGTPLALISLNKSDQNVTSVKTFIETPDGFQTEGNGNSFHDSGYLPELSEALYHLREEGVAKRFDALVEPNIQRNPEDNMFSMLTRDGKWEKFRLDVDPGEYLAGTADIRDDEGMFWHSNSAPNGLDEGGLTRDKLEALAGNAGITLSIADLTDTYNGTEPASDKLELFPDRVDAHIRVRDHGTHDLTRFSRIASLDATNADRVHLQSGAIREDDIEADHERTKFEFFRVQRTLVSEADGASL